MEENMQQEREKEYYLGLMIDHLTGSISKTSQQDLDAWIELSHSNKEYFNEIKSTWKSVGFIRTDKRFDEKEAYHIFEGAIIEKRNMLRRMLRYAAIIVPFVFISYFAYSYFVLPKHDNNNFISKISVPNGSKSQIELKDGTKIWLNSGSVVELDSKFGNSERRIKLYGEAYLEVSKNEECPFILETGTLEVKVLGTTFNVNYYKENDEIKLALIEGSVELIVSAENSTIMKPNDLATYNLLSEQIAISKNGMAEATAWMQNRLIFEGYAFDKIVDILERNYNVKINVHQQSLKNKRFVGDFVNNETIEQVLKVMSSNQRFSYTIDGNNINIY